MGIVGRGIIFTIGTFANALVFLFHGRVLLPFLDTATSIVGSGPADGAFNLLPVAMQLAMGVLQLGLIVYFIGGLGEERAANSRPLP